MSRKPMSLLWLIALLSMLVFSSANAQNLSSQDALQALMLLPLQAEYQAAVVNAQANLLHLQSPPANPSIWDINADNKNLVWSGAPGSSQVLMTTFTRASYYASNSPGQTLPAGADLWVTPATQAVTAIKAEYPNGVVPTPKLAMSEYLGLPPVNGDDSMVSVWVSPQNLVRPAIDPSIDNHQLETMFPVSLQTVPITPAPTMPKESPAPGFGPSSNYPSWFANRESTIYRSDISGGPYPWTGLGYTYNWTPGAPDVVGGSEFIIPQGSPVTLQSVIPVDNYLK